MVAKAQAPALSLGQALALGTYATVLRLGVPAYLWRVWSRGREEPAYRAAWWERLGVHGAAHRRRVAESAARGGPLVWVHAVSLGEARAAAGLVAALRHQQPDLRLLLTHTTATGRDAGRDLLSPQGADLQTWLPLDTPGAVRRFLRTHRPQVGVLMETEVWPVLQRETARAGIPMVLANARLSAKSLRQGLRLSALLRPAAQAMHSVLAQTEGDAERMRELLDGAAVQPQARARFEPELVVCGNLKFDMTPEPALLALGQQWREAGTPARPVVLAASTREGEEVGLLQAWKAAHEAHSVDDGPWPRLCIVPRHPQRFDEVAALVLAQGWSLSRRSQWPDQQPDAAALRADVWLGDSMKEMPAYCAAARVALLGGSFLPLGGQNLIEPAACACPVVMGPSTFNFAEAAELSEAAGAATRVADWAQGVAVAIRQAQAPRAEQALRQARCLAFTQAHRGAAQRMAQRILALL